MRPADIMCTKCELFKKMLQEVTAVFKQTHIFKKNQGELKIKASLCLYCHEGGQFGAILLYTFEWL